jgi:hypothetical protein
MSMNRRDLVAVGSRTWSSDSPCMEALESRTMLAAPTAAIAGMWSDATTLTVVIEWGNVNPATLGSGDVQASANGREPLVGTIIGSPVLMPNGNYRVAYLINAYDNAWGVTDNGQYTFTSPIGEVVSPQGDVLSNSFVGTRGLWWATPKARLITQTMRTTDWLIVVQYDTLNGIDQSTIDGSDLKVFTGEHNGISIYQIINVSSTSIKVVYKLDAPNGAWSHKANGSYILGIGADAVKDNAGRGVPEHQYRRFGLWFATPHAHVHNTTVGENDWLIPIRYTPLPGYTMNLASILNAGVLRVTGPGGFDVLSETVGFVSNLDGSYVVTYRFVANGGSWDFRDNGKYQLIMNPNMVADSAARLIPTYTMKTFSLWFTNPAAEVASSTKVNNTTWDLSIRFRDDVQLDLSTITAGSIRVVNQFGLEVPFSLISITPGGNAATQTALYRVVVAGGLSGQYRVYLNRDGVRDSTGKIAAESLIGTFTF